MMKATFRVILFLGVFLGFLSQPCLALRSIGIITREIAKAEGMEVRISGTGEQVWVELEFKPEGRFKDFHQVELEIGEGENIVVAYAALKETRMKDGRILVRFLTVRAELEKITLCVVAGLDAGDDVRLKDFVERQK